MRPVNLDDIAQVICEELESKSALSEAVETGSAEVDVKLKVRVKIDLEVLAE